MTGYDGNGYEIGDRVELSPACDLWMRGAKFGTVVGTHSTPDDRVIVVLDVFPQQPNHHRRFMGSEDLFRRID